MVTKNQIKFIRGLAQKKNRVITKKIIVEGQKIINELGSVNSSMRFGNFLQGIQIYQNYKTNKRLK